MPGNDATRKKSAGRTKIETINPNAGVLPFNLIQTFASGSLCQSTLLSLPGSNEKVYTVIRPFTCALAILSFVGSKTGIVALFVLNCADEVRFCRIPCNENTMLDGADT
jgi:hypothetical protein